MQPTEDDRELRDQWKERKVRPWVLLFTNTRIFLKNNDTEEKAPVCTRMRVGMEGGKRGAKKERRGDSLRMSDPIS